MVGRVFSLNHDGTIRLLLQGGPGVYTKRDAAFTIQSSSYNYEIESNKSICLVVNPKIEIPLGNVIGLSAGPMLVMDNTDQYIGAGIGIMYGIVGRN